MELGGTVFIETTIPSVMCRSGLTPGAFFRRELTQAWWSDELRNYEVRSSDAVILELRAGSWPGQTDALKLLDPIALIPVDDEIIRVARRFIQERVVPAGTGGDAVHLATACVHAIDFLLTWNIRHLANPNKQHHLAVVCGRMGLLAPQIVTPETLWKE